MVILFVEIVILLFYRQSAIGPQRIVPLLKLNRHAYRKASLCSPLTASFQLAAPSVFGYAKSTSPKASLLGRFFADSSPTIRWGASALGKFLTPHS